MFLAEETNLRWQNAHERPRYTLTRAAQYVQIAPATLRSWVVGRPYDGGKGYQPIGAVSTHQVEEGHRCQGNINCVPLCPVQAKYNAGKTLAVAFQTGRCQVPFTSPSDSSEETLRNHSVTELQTVCVGARYCRVGFSEFIASANLAFSMYSGVGSQMKSLMGPRLLRGPREEFQHQTVEDVFLGDDDLGGVEGLHHGQQDLGTCDDHVRPSRRRPHRGLAAPPRRFRPAPAG